MVKKNLIFLLFCCLLIESYGFMTKDALASSELKFLRKLSNTYMKKVKDYEEYASVYMDRHNRDYYSIGAGDMETLKDNEKAFSRFLIRPKLLRNVARRNMNLTVFGQNIGMPFGVSPIAFQKMAHPDGELGTARAVASVGGIMIMSMFSTTSVEDIQTKTPPGSVHWLQIYIAKDRDLTKTVVQRADAAGFKAIVVTIDSPVNGMWGVNMIHNLTLPANLKLPNLNARGAAEISGSNLRSKVGVTLLDPSLTWKDIQWIQTFTALPIVVKGVLTAEDAILAVEHGASGILVSNHGGRQLDGVPATLDVLPEIVRAVKGKAEVFLDGGVRRGSDVFKALALGARAAFFGRPLIWGLVHSGEEGVSNMLNIVKNQLDTTMALAGAPELKDIERSHVIRAETYLHETLEK